MKRRRRHTTHRRYWWSRRRRAPRPVPTQPAAARAAATAVQAGSRRGWASVGAVALGAFIIVMTETLPVGLLPQIADGLHVSVGLAGLMVLVPGVSAAVSAPLLFLGASRFDRRSVIVVLV
jgi:predicted MFS family arabinose efflux permease